MVGKTIKNVRKLHKINLAATRKGRNYHSK